MNSRKRAARELPPNFFEYGGPPIPWWPLLLPAATVLPFVRSPLGYEIVYPKERIKWAVLLFLLPPMLVALWQAFSGHVLKNPGLIYLTLYFAPASLLLSLLIFARRCWGQRRSEQVHTASTGYSWLTWYTNLPLELSEQILTPLALLLAGYAIAHSFSQALGWWLILSGISLLILARYEHRRLWHHRRTPVDDEIHARVYEERMRRQEQRGKKPGKKDKGGDPDEADLA
jgi:hypothetical protein